MHWNGLVNRQVMLCCRTCLNNSFITCLARSSSIQVNFVFNVVARGHTFKALLLDISSNVSSTSVKDLLFVSSIGNNLINV